MQTQPTSSTISASALNRGMVWSASAPVLCGFGPDVKVFLSGLRSFVQGAAFGQFFRKLVAGSRPASAAGNLHSRRSAGDWQHAGTAASPWRGRGGLPHAFSWVLGSSLPGPQSLQSNGPNPLLMLFFSSLDHEFRATPGQVQVSTLLQINVKVEKGRSLPPFASPCAGRVDQSAISVSWIRSKAAPACRRQS